MAGAAALKEFAWESAWDGSHWAGQRRGKVEPKDETVRYEIEIFKGSLSHCPLGSLRFTSCEAGRPLGRLSRAIIDNGCKLIWRKSGGLYALTNGGAGGLEGMREGFGAGVPV